MVAEQARTAGGRITAVTTSTSSPLAELADLVIPIPAASRPDHGVESSAQFAESLIVVGGSITRSADPAGTVTAFQDAISDVAAQPV
jgi:DNA-binding MurR/RpiR family transcriptional regulator